MKLAAELLSKSVTGYKHLKSWVGELQNRELYIFLRQNQSAAKPEKLKCVYLPDHPNLLKWINLIPVWIIHFYDS